MRVTWGEPPGDHESVAIAGVLEGLAGQAVHLPKLDSGADVLLVTDPKGNKGEALMRWRLAGWVTLGSGGTAFIKVRHYGPGSASSK